MFKPQTFVQAACAVSRFHISTANIRYIIPHVQRSTRWLSCTQKLTKDGSKADPYHSSSTAAGPTDKQAHEGSFSRTNREVSFEYPNEESFPRSRVMQGRGGPHYKRTLPTFSMEDKVVVITGGARGLGLVMGQALTASGADLAIVDLNRELSLWHELASLHC
jgi:D-arabinitol 2-dehydrogenase